MTNYEKLEKVLTELFQLDKAELDFGIYRIMNQKRDDVLDFLKNTLPKEVRTILEGQKQGDAISLKKELDKAIKTAKDFGAPDPEATPKVQEARAAYESAGSIDGLEQEVFSHLASFFKRYYEGGDFISLRRYKKDVYSIPYEGEEVKLHWANHDQYYIKTSENLKNYAFKVDGDKTVKFTLKEANTEHNNNKTQNDKERRFALYEEEPVTIDGKTIHLNFTYEPHKKSVKQDNLLEIAVAQLTEIVPADFTKIFSLATTEKNKKRTLLEKHLNDFSARNTFDYFIHKDLGGFLTRELDFYIKNEVLFIDDINTDNEQAFTTQLSKIRALKQVASKIITFLSQLENFQKKLWLKKKFVISCDYCITLDRVPESYYNKIANNRAQVAEWRILFNVNIEKQDDLKDEPYLVLDTKFFSEEFKDQLLAEFEDLEKQTNGLLINSENFQALNLISEKFKSKLDVSYIDPPYNTNSSPIAYKNNYKHSSWNSLMVDRLTNAKILLKNTGISVTAIDDIELKNLYGLLDFSYGHDNYISTITSLCNPQGRVADFQSKTSEYHLVYAKNKNSITNNFKIDKIDNFREKTPFKRTGSNSKREERPLRYYPIFYKNKKLSLLSKDQYLNIYNRDTRSFDDIYLSNIIDKYEKEGYEVILPLKMDGSKLVWQREYDRALKEIDTYIYQNGTIYTPGFNDEIPTTCWTSSKYANPEYGTEYVKEILGSKYLKMVDHKVSLNTAKSIHTLKQFLKMNDCDYVIDYFAGSGTTAHAAISNFRESNKITKFISVEMGWYFDKILKSRLIKAIYSDEWSDGYCNNINGVSYMFKYSNLESYEDTLNNLQLKPNQIQQQLLDTNSNLKEEYLLQYMLDVESRDQLLNIETFKNPFNYKLNITENNELVPTNVDLVETFNYLIGLHVKRVQRIGAFKTVEGITNTGDKVLVIWRNLEESNNDDLNTFVKKLDYNLRDGEFDTIYVNGDNNLANLRQDEETWKVLLLEEVFFTAMFDVKDI